MRLLGTKRAQAELSSKARAANLYGLENQGSPTQLVKELSVSRNTIYNTKINSNSTIP
jgi:hypothetical protein